MKAVISNRIYLQCTSSMKQSIDKELTYLIPSHNPADPPQVISNMAVIREDLISIPHRPREVCRSKFFITHAGPSKKAVRRTGLTVAVTGATVRRNPDTAAWSKLLLPGKGCKELAA